MRLFPEVMKMLRQLFLGYHTRTSHAEDCYGYLGCNACNSATGTMPDVVVS